MADKITAKELAGKKDDFVIIDVREADKVAEDGKRGSCQHPTLTADKKNEAWRTG